MENKLHKLKTITGLLIIGIFIGAIISQGYRWLMPSWGKTNDSVQGIVTTPTPIPTQELQESDTVDEPMMVCEYIDNIKGIAYTPSANDDIQDIIGYQNNKFGIYIYAEVNDFMDMADELVNSNGGEWGYVLIPYNVKDRNENRWGDLFVRLAEKKLIPIIQLWDLDLEDDKRNKQIQGSAEFLNTLQWPIKHRYISVYNEPNDANFWKGEINPEQYADVLDKTITAFKTLDNDFFMLNGAFNSSARTGQDHLDVRDYMRTMNRAVPGIFARLDGWASHPYPQPNFSGPVNSTGRDSIRAYDWELNFLKNEFKIDTAKLPVFITETGWAHIESEESGNENGYKYNQHQVADNFVKAFNDVWLKDPKVVAVTPFTIRYDKPFDHFSWVTKNGNPYPQFDAIKNMKKIQGKPPSLTYARGKILDCEYKSVTP
ncbi:MAG: hypothetical protein QG570_563 [Patescibacteria group bacterium]|nr:hypothetical protein [Patescibacteria group bacterium]